jgi:uncharacterized repeat protein (TIGR01451 family)
MVIVIAIVLAAPAMAQAPAAGTKIGNQASATYTDASNVSRTATSNAVYTTVQQVASLTLTANGAKNAAPGAQVAYPHTLINTGNGTDSFTLNAAALGGSQFTHTGIAIYIDANGDGVPDNTTNLAGTSVSLAAGAVFKFVLVGSVPNTATAGQTGGMTVSATSVFNNAVSATDTDTTTVTGNAVINATKALSQNTGLAGSGPYTVTLTYTNNGNATATGVKFTDALPAGMTYVAGSGRWSVTGSTVLTDATGDVQPAVGSPNIDYSYAAGTVTATINSIAPGVSGTITFQVNIASGTAPGTISNTADLQYNDGSGNTVNSTTNAAIFTVQQQAGVTINDTGVLATDADATLNKIATVASAVQGATVAFTNVIKNTGNGTDSFNVTIGASTFPAGTTFALYKSDGVTPLIDTNGDGIPDSGPLAPNATYTVIVKATLPAGATGGPFTATATATSVFNAGANDAVTERLTAITANTADITNNAALAQPGVLGTGAGPEGSSVVTNATNPGTTTVFTLYVNNTSTVADSYDLVASNTTTFGSNNTVPAGWNVTFRLSNGSDCSTTNLGTAITNTGVVNASANRLVCAVVSVPSGYAAGTVDMYFRALSPTSGAVDAIHDAVTVNVLHQVTLTPNNSGQVFPGGSVTYTHTVANTGNVTETISFSAPITSDSLSGWGSVLYQDNGTTAGILDPGDSAVTTSTTFNLAPGASVTVFVKVNAPAGAPTGAIDATTVVAKYNSGASSTSATDSSTVINGNLQLLKEQALDSGCNNSPGSFGQGDITVGAVPGACVIYRITATNVGAANVTSVVVSDATPAFTVYNSTPAASTTVGTISAPANGTAGTITATVGTLTPGQSAVITFSVKITQ